jgi:hypothetical protein
MIAVKHRGGPQHLVFGLALQDGSVLPGFPVNVAQALSAKGISFIPRLQNERGALVIANNTLFIPYGGHDGDCGAYHGWVVAVNLSNPALVAGWSTRAEGGGIWAPGGISYDGRSLFVATGNTKGANQWSDGEAVFSLGTDLSVLDSFAASDWAQLDAADADLGGTNPLPIDVSDSSGTAHLLLSLGKDGKAYVLNRDNLGGIGGALVVQQVANGAIVTAPAVYLSSDTALVAFKGPARSCPKANSNLAVLAIRAHPSPTITTAWCASLNGNGAPIVTTTDGSANPIVWIVGPEGDNRLHGFRGDTGQEVSTALNPMKGLRHFVTILAADGRLFVGADSRIYAFTL